MKSFNLYREQVDCVTNWFKSWTECEQTVALYSLLKRVSDTQARFLCHVLEQKLKTCPELDMLEEEANDPEYVLNLGQENIQKALTLLLSHLPLLRMGNLSAKSEYWRILPQVLDSECYMDEGKELLSYALIHPAVTANERSWLAQLQQDFLARITASFSQNVASREHDPWKTSPGATLASSENDARVVTGKPPIGRSWEAVNSPQSQLPYNAYSNIDQICKTHTPLQSAASAPSPYQHSSLEKNTIWNAISDATPDISVVNPDSHISPLPPAASTWMTPPSHVYLQSTLSAPNIKLSPVQPARQINNVATNNSTPSQSSGHQQLRRTLSVTSPGYILPPTATNQHGQPAPLPEHKTVSPQSSAASSSSGSDGHPSEVVQRNSFLERGSGMRDVPTWLRHLRLHKYAHLFQTMSYEEMLDITEDWLLSQNVTAGASNKIMLSIKRLRGRQSILVSLEKELAEGGVVPVILEEMKSMLDMPLKEFTPSAGDGPSPPSDQSAPQSSSTANNVEMVEIAEGDVPGQFTRLLLKVTTQLLVGEPNPKSFQMCRQLITKCINHEAFTEKLKKTLESRKVALEACHSHMVRFRAYNRQAAFPNTRVGNPPSPRTFPAPRRPPQNWVSGSGSWPCSKPQPSLSPAVQWSFGSKRAVLGGTTSSHTPLSRCHTNPIVVSRPSALEGKQALSRTQSAPLHSNVPALSVTNRPGSSDIGGHESDYNAQLESLCISMTEHALSGSEGIEAKTSTPSLKPPPPAPYLSADQSAQWYC